MARLYPTRGSRLYPTGADRLYPSAGDSTGLGGSTGGEGGGDPNFASVTLLVGFDGADGATSATDESSIGHTLTFNGNAQLDTDQQKFGTASLLCDGTGDYVEAGDHDGFSFGADDFTIEGFVRVADTNGFILASKYTENTNTAEWTLNWNGTNLLFIGFYGSGGSDFVIVSGAASFTVGTWHHVAVDRSGDTWRVYLDGDVVASLTEARTLVNRDQPLWIGMRNHTTALPLNGHIDEVRITKGVARYAGAFTPPSEAFPRS